MMTVHEFLGMMMMSSFTTIDKVDLRMKGVLMKSLGKIALRQCEYCGFRDDHVLTFEIYDRTLVLNLRPTF